MYQVGTKELRYFSIKLFHEILDTYAKDVYRVTRYLLDTSTHKTKY